MREMTMTASRTIAEVAAKEPALAATAILLACAALPIILLIFTDARSVDGVNVWVKPLKFTLSLSLYAATLAWFALWLPDTLKAELWYRPYVGAVVAAILVEQIWLCAAAAFGLRSHFNYDHAFFAPVYPLMGLIAIFLTSITLVYGVAILFNAAAPLAGPVRSAVGLGLMLTFVLTVIVAGTLAVSGPRYGGSPNGPGIPIFGWRPSGDLRAAHFFATHAMHFLPAAGWMLARDLPAKLATSAVIAFAGIYAIFVSALFFGVIRTAE